jgi:hypothetical protein
MFTQLFMHDGYGRGAASIARWDLTAPHRFSMASPEPRFREPQISRAGELHVEITRVLGCSSRIQTA